MSPRPHRRRILMGLLAALSTLAAAAPAQAARPLTTAVVDGRPFAGSGMQTNFQRSRAAGASLVRLYVGWSDIAPAGNTPPTDFRPRDPADSHYRWSFLDHQISTAKRGGLDVVLSIMGAPAWAERRTGTSRGRAGTANPDPRAYGDFAAAIAQRYSGRFAGLPRVRYWQAWNEPNHSKFFNPQFNTPEDQRATAKSKVLSADLYRELLNAFAVSVHAANASNKVVVGGLAPFRQSAPYAHVAPPLPFTRELLCLDRRNRPRSGCTERARFDVMAMHPYTSGGPRHDAYSSNDVSIGDLDELRRALRAGVRHGRVISRRSPSLWVTEFSWDTKPPDPYGVPTKVHARWVAEAMYRMWTSGVSVVTWFQVRDDPYDMSKKGLLQDGFQAGLYFRCSSHPNCARPKPSLAAFRFPFVVLPKSRRSASIWGRTPTSRRATVIVEQRRAGRWRRTAKVRSDSKGIFRKRVRLRGRGYLRARVGKQRSVTFPPKRLPDRPVNPFGDMPPAAGSNPWGL